MTPVNIQELSETMIWEVFSTEGVTLWDMIESHESRGMLVPSVDCPCDSLPGDDDEHLFIGAFFKVLQFHLASGQIVGDPDDETNRLWELWRENRLKSARLRSSGLISEGAELLPKRFGLLASVPLALSEDTYSKVEHDEPLKHVELIQRFGPRQLSWRIVSTTT